MNEADLQQHLKFEFPELGGKDRLRELILYIAHKCSSDPTFGATKLNKILFYSDFLSFFHFGEPIAGLEYQKLPNGPAPKQLVPVRDEMKRKGDLVVQRAAFFDKEQHRCIPLREPDLTAFKGRDIALLDALIQHLWGKTAAQVSELSHQRAWRLAKDRESIPYQAAFLSDDDNFSETELARVAALNKEHGWE